MRMKLNDGQMIIGKDAAELVRNLHEISLAPAEDDEAFMKQTAERTLLQTGQRIRFNEGPGVFVSDLISCGLMWEQFDEKH